MDARGLALRTSDPALVVDTEGKVVGCNPGLLELLGYEAESEVLGRGCWSVVRAITPQGDSFCSPTCVPLECFRCGRPFGTGEVICHRADGSRVRAAIGSLVLPNCPDGRPVVLIFLRPVGASGAAGVRPSSRPVWAYTLGPFHLYVAGQPLELHRWRRKQALVLLKYLVVHRERRVHREELLELLWPDAPVQTGLQRLKVVIYFLRRQLAGQDGGAAAVLVKDGENYYLDPSRLWVDAQVFEEAADRGDRLMDHRRRTEAVESYRLASSLYRGDFMADEPYADWCFLERERLRERFIEVQVRLGSLYMDLALYREAVHAYRRALALDPCRELVHRGLMWALWFMGRRDEALRQYRLCEEALAREMGTAPSHETRHLCQRIARAEEPLRAS